MLNEDSVPTLMIDLVRMFPQYTRDPDDFKCDPCPISTAEGFFKAFNAQDLKTGERVFVREYDADLEKNSVLFGRFLTEAFCLASSDHRHIVDLIGFTWKPPYLLITKRCPEGNFYDSFCTKKSEPLSGTRATIMFLVMAASIRYLHSKNILIRNLKPEVFDLDSKKLPVLSNITCACVKSPHSMKKKVGTPEFMAPEMWESNSYDEKVDIYSFAFVFYEFCEKKHFFTNLTEKDIQDKVIIEDLRPPFEKTPRPIAKLIEKMWSPDPSRRPSADEIFNMLSHGKVAFPHTEQDKVRKFAESLLADESSRLANGKEVIPLYADVPIIIESLENPGKLIVVPTPEDEKKQQISKSPSLFVPKSPSLSLEKISSGSIPKSFSSEMTKSPSIIEALSARANNSFEDLMNIAKVITPKDFPLFYVSVYSKSCSGSLITTAIQTCPKFADYLLSKGYLATLHGKTVGEKNIIWAIVKYRSFLMSDLPLNDILTNDKMFGMTILLHYSKEVVQISQFLTCIDSIKQFWNTAEFLSICCLAKDRLPDFIVQRFSMFQDIVDHVMKTDAEFAIKAASHLGVSPSDFENVAPYSLSPYLLHIIVNSSKLPPSPRLVSLLIAGALEDQRITLVLCKYISISKENADVFAANNALYSMRLPTLEDTFRLLLITVKMTPSVLEQNGFYQLVTLGLEKGNKNLLYNIPLIFRSLQITPQMVNMLTQNGFIKACVSFLLGDNDVYINARGITVLDQFARVAYSSDFELAMPWLRRLMSNEQLVPAIIGLLTVFSVLPQMKTVLAVPDLISYFQSLYRNPNYQVYAATFLQRVL